MGVTQHGAVFNGLRRWCRRVGQEGPGNASSLCLKSLCRLVLKYFRLHGAGLGRAALPAAALPCSFRVATGLLTAPGSCSLKSRSAFWEGRS